MFQLTHSEQSVGKTSEKSQKKIKKWTTTVTSQKEENLIKSSDDQ